MRRTMRTPRLLCYLPSLLLCLMLLTAHGAQADTAGDKKRAQLANVKRILVIPPFFGTDTLSKDHPQDEKTVSDTPPNAAQNKAKYLADLRKLQTHAAEALPQRVADRTPYTVVPAAEVTQAMKDLKLTPEKLFQNNGRMQGTHFALPDLDAVRQLAARVHADAVLLGTLDEPRRTNGHYYLDFGGVNYESSHVRSKAGFFVLLADGTEVLHDYLEVMHPLTRIGEREYLLADWTESEDLLIENFMDELTRYTPKKS